MIFRKWVKQIGRHRFGYTHDLVYEDGQPYLQRRILWFGFTLRIHTFHKGDDDRAFHDHPWWFITVPLKPYLEITPGGGESTLRRYWPHFRSAQHRHIVRLIEPGPVRTIILTGPKSKEWGFWDQEQFIHHSEWLGTDDSI